MRIHLCEFDAHAFTGDDVADDRFGENHAAGYFKDEGEIGAYSLGYGAAEEEASLA